MATEVIEKGPKITHIAAKRSYWDNRAISACGRTFVSGTFKEPLIYGGVDCADCREVRRTGTLPCRCRR